MKLKDKVKRKFILSSFFLLLFLSLVSSAEVQNERKDTQAESGKLKNIHSDNKIEENDTKPRLKEEVKRPKISPEARLEIEKIKKSLLKKKEEEKTHSDSNKNKIAVSNNEKVENKSESEDQMKNSNLNLRNYNKHYKNMDHIYKIENHEMKVNLSGLDRDEILVLKNLLDIFGKTKSIDNEPPQVEEEEEEEIVEVKRSHINLLDNEEKPKVIEKNTLKVDEMKYPIKNEINYVPIKEDNIFYTPKFSNKGKNTDISSDVNYDIRSDINSEYKVSKQLLPVQYTSRLQNKISQYLRRPLNNEIESRDFYNTNYYNYIPVSSNRPIVENNSLIGNYQLNSVANKRRPYTNYTPERDNYLSNINFMQNKERLKGKKFFKSYKDHLYDSVMKYYYNTPY